MKKWVWMAMLLLFSLSLSGCSVPSSASEVPVAVPFDATKAHVNDRVGEMKITHIQDVVEDKEGLLTAYIDLEGPVTISGTYTHHGEESELIGPAVSFEPDFASAKKIPQVKGTNRAVWFLLSNYDDTSKDFGPPGSTGKATITIDHYKINVAPIAAWDTAELVKIERINK